MLYPAIFDRDKNGYINVTFRDIPEAITFGDSYEDAIAMAEDALATAMKFYFEDKRIVPNPSVIGSGNVATRAIHSLIMA